MIKYVRGEIKMTIGENIKYHRKARKLTQKRLAELIDKKDRTIQKYEKGTVENIKRSVIQALALALDTTPCQLMGWDSSSPAKKEDSKSSELLYKYNKLDNKGKHTVNTILEVEYNRCLYDIELNAAHYDGLTEEEKSIVENKVQEILKNRNKNNI